MGSGELASSSPTTAKNSPREFHVASPPFRRILSHSLHHNIGNGVAYLTHIAIVVTCRLRAESNADNFPIADETTETKNRTVSCETVRPRRRMGLEQQCRQGPHNNGIRSCSNTDELLWSNTLTQQGKIAPTLNRCGSSSKKYPSPISFGKTCGGGTPSDVVRALRNILH